MLAGPLPAMAIPATLHDSLLARLDRLAPVKEVAQVGAVIGREFGTRAARRRGAAAGGPAGRGAGAELIGAELVFRRGLPPEAVYVFKHALVQEAAYASLLKSRRQQLHARVAQVLEERFPEDRRRAAGAARPPLRRGGPRREGARVLVAGRASGPGAVGAGGGGRASPQGAGRCWSPCPTRAGARSWSSRSGPRWAAR